MGDAFDAAFDADHANTGASADPFDLAFDAAHGNTAPEKQWNLGSSIKQSLSGLAEGGINTLAMASDYLPWNLPETILTNVQKGRYFGGPTMDKAQEVLAPVVSAQDPKYRAERTISNFVGGNLAMPGGGIPMKVATGVGGGLGQVVGENLTKGGEDNVWDKIVPLAFSVAGAMGPQAAGDFMNSAYSLFRSATPAEIKGSAAHLIQNDLGIAPEEIAAPMIANPSDEMSALKSTAELTQNARMAQLEKNIASEGEPSQIYAQRAADREAARMATLRGDLPAVNKGGLGRDLNKAAIATDAAMTAEQKALWKGFPRYESIDIPEGQVAVAEVLGNKQAGLFPTGDAKKLLDQFLKMPDQNATSGALQDLRSDALKLMRTKDLSNIEVQALSEMNGHIEAAMDRGLTGKAYDQWVKARDATRLQAETYGQGTAGNALLQKSTKPQSRLASALTGEEESIFELANATGNNPALMQKVKRGFVDSIKTDTDRQLTQNKMKDFLDANEGASKALLGEKHHSALERIYEDLKSENSVGKIAFRSSKGNSVTSQRSTVAGAIDKLIAESVTPGTGGALGLIIDAIKQTVGVKNAGAVKDLIFRAAMEPSFALELSLAPTTTRIFNGLERLGQIARNAGTAGARAGAVDLSNPGSPPAGPKGYSGRDPSFRGAVSPGFANQPAAAPTLQPGGKQQASPQVVPQSTPAAKLSNTSFDNSSSVFAPLQSTDNFSVFKPIVLQTIKAAERNSTGKTSPKGAQGTYQLMPEIQKHYGVKDPFDDKESGEAAWKLIKEEADALGGDWQLAFAAFNAGRPAVKRAMAKTGGDTWDEIASAMPKETRDYVVKAEDVFSKLISEV